VSPATTLLLPRLLFPPPTFKEEAEQRLLGVVSVVEDVWRDS
jgi:hypothetical protein